MSNRAHRDRRPCVGPGDRAGPRTRTRTVRIELDFLGYDPTGLQGEPRIGFAGRTAINRSDYGVSFGLVDGGRIVVADKVDIRLDVEAVYAGPADAA